jgi:insertion element IS1 protein InsB
MGDHSAKTFQPLWELVRNWKCYFYVTDGWPVYPMFIPDGDQIICKTYMTRVEGENTRLRHYLARLHRKTLCYSKSKEMLAHSVRLLIALRVTRHAHYLKFWDVPVPYPANY